MSFVNRQTSRVSTVESSTAPSERKGSRPSLLTKGLDSFRGSRGGNHARNQSSSAASSGGGDVVGEKAGHQDLRGFTGVFPIPDKSSQVGHFPELKEEEEEKYDQVLEYFRNQKDFPVSLHAANTERKPASEWEKLRLLSRESMLRYLRASKWDVTIAKKRLTDTIAWSREFGIDGLEADEMAKEAQSGKETVLGYDNLSRPLHYMHPHRNNTKETPRQMQYAVWILERCIDLMPPGTEQLALLINFDHKSRNPTSIANAKLMLYILQNHYVERLGIALCINVPWVFKLFWNAIQPFIDPVTKSKCKFDSAIKTEVPLNQLSSEFGGELDATYNHELYWPDLVELSAERRREMIRRFRDDCNSEIGASEWVIRGGDDPTSPFNAKDRATPSELTTTSKSSEAVPPSKAPLSELQETKSGRGTAIDASNNRMDNSASNFTTIHSDEPSTPLERYKTPSEIFNSRPLDRTFSTASVSAVSAAGRSSGSGFRSNEERSASASGKEHARSGSVTKSFKDLNHKIHDSLIRPFQNSPNSSPRSSRDLSKRTGHEDAKTKRSSSSALPNAKHEKEKAADIDRKENVENGQDRSASATASTTEAAKVAATGGLGGVVGALATSGSVEKIPSNNTKAAMTTTTTTTCIINMFFFAAAKEAAGVGSIKITLPSSSFPLSELGDHLVQNVSQNSKGDSTALKKVLKQSKWSVNEDMVDEEDIHSIFLKGGEDVAIIPPVSGG
ncbi:hypothetical protein CBS101457_003160 [Exobasidium rhododendri]|nr:hypothetical protein CBS101457_003160 [Exobasidium rhododendri]